MAIDTGYSTSVPYAVPGEAVVIDNDVQRNFINLYEAHLARKQQYDFWGLKIQEERRTQNAKDLKDLLDFNPEVIRGEYQPYFTEKINNEWMPAAQKAKLGAHLTTEEEQRNVTTIQNNILKEVNMVNKLDQKVQEYYKFMTDENERQSRAGRAPEYNLNYGLSAMNSLFKNDDGSRKKPVEIDFNQLDGLLSDPQVGLIGARFENFFTDLDQMSASMMEEVPSQGGNPAWKILGVSWADVFETEEKGGVMVPQMVNGKLVPKVSDELLYLMRTERPDLYTQVVDDAASEDIPIKDLVARAIRLHQGKLYKPEIKEIRNITNPYAAQGVKRGEHMADVSQRVANDVSMVENRDPTLLGIIQASGKYQGTYPIVNVRYVEPMGPFQQGEEPLRNAIEIKYKVNEFGLPQFKTEILSLDKEEDVKKAFPQVNAYHNRADEGTGKTVSWDEWWTEFRKQMAAKQPKTNQVIQPTIESPTKKKIPGL